MSQLFASGGGSSANTVTGTGTTDRLAKWSSTSTITASLWKEGATNGELQFQNFASAKGTRTVPLIDIDPGTGTGLYTNSAGDLLFASNGNFCLGFNGNPETIFPVANSLTNYYSFRQGSTEFDIKAFGSGTGSVYAFWFKSGDTVGSINIKNASGSGIAQWNAATSTDASTPSASWFNSDLSRSIIIGNKGHGSGVMEAGSSTFPNLNAWTIKGAADQTNTGGTTTANASTTITGVGTKFTQEYGLYDRVSLSSASSTYAYITAIASATSMTVSTALGNGTSQTLNKKQSLFSVQTNAGAVQAFVGDLGFLSVPGAGVNSERFGFESLAAGNSAVALGRGASAAGANGISIGKDTTSSVSSNLVVIGGGSSITGSGSDGAVAIGTSISNSGGINGAVLIGSQISTGSVVNCIAIGLGPSIGANSDGAIAIGNNAAIIGGAVDCIAIGVNARVDNASATYGIAIGLNAEVSGLGGIVIGENANIAVLSVDSIAIGGGASVNTGNSQSTCVGIGSFADNGQVTAFGFATTSTGVQSVVIGYTATITDVGDYSVVIGAGATTAIDHCVVIGYAAVAFGTQGIAIGSNGVSCGGDYGIAIGNQATTNDTDGIAIGDASTALGNASIAIGNAVTANSASSSGLGCTAIGSGFTESTIGNFSMGLGAKWLTLNSSGASLPAGKIVQYNGINTVTNGVSSLYATSDLNTQAAAIAATTVYAVPSTGIGLYRVSFVATITRAATASSVLGGTSGFQIRFTDPNDSVVKTSTALSIFTSSANTTATTISGSLIANCKASTNLQYLFDYSSVGVTTMQYDLSIRVEAI